MEQGDIMKLKRWHLYLIVTLCFTIAFISINRKYDRFYRVNGINNDKTKENNNIAYGEYLPNNDILYICNDDGTISTTEDEMIEHLEKHLQGNLPGDGSYHTEYKNVQTDSNTIPSWNY